MEICDIVMAIFMFR